jgi:transcriptional regulator with XRE-family HTH domain
MHTGDAIREFRERAGLSQKTLAKALHITDKAVSKWERGLSHPDVALLPKLALLLDTDIDHLLSRNIEEEPWVGLIEIENCDFSQIVYDKPLVYYLLIHYLLVGITTVHFQTSKPNEEYLRTLELKELGFDIRFERPEEKNVMLLTHPWFLFGSDLTEQFRGAMLTKRMLKVVPANQEPVFFFIPSDMLDMYYSDKKRFLKRLNKRDLGRGMICLDMSDHDRILDVAMFVRTYQNNVGLLIGSLEEIAYKRGLLNDEQFGKYCEETAYGSLLKSIKGELTVG